MKTAYGIALGKNVRYIDIRRFVHCHNKLVIIDQQNVLLSSQNWSSTGIKSNREAGVLVTHAPLAKYYAAIFDSDWSTASKKIPKPGGVGTVTPEVVARGGFVEVRAADYEDV